MAGRRILHISTRLILGGSQENTILSCEGQADAGDTVGLVYGPIYGPEGSLQERAEKHGGIELIETPHLIRELSPRRDQKCYRDLRKLIRDWRPDVVHTHSSKAGVLGRAAAWKEKVPAVIHTIHGLAFHPYLPAWKNHIYIAAEKWAAKRCHTIVCVAEAMREQALAKGVGRREQYEIVYSGMEVDAYLHPQWSREEVRNELGLNEDDFVIGTVARLAELKGHDDLLDALGDDLKKDKSLKLLWVGDGWRRDELLARIEQLGVRDQIILTGLVPPDQIPKYLQAMDVLCHPSYREGLPRTVTQALLSATAAAAYDVDGTGEVCIDGETGRLIPPGDRTALRETLLWLREHPKERATMGEHGRALCRERFAAETMVRDLDAIYNDVLGRAADRGHGSSASP